MEYKTDSLLVHLARAGDEDACEKLVKKYYSSIYQYCLLHIYDPYEAEDLTQEVFTRFFSNLYRYKEYGKVKNYLYTIAGNTVKNYYKKKKDIPSEELLKSEDCSKNHVEELGVRLTIEQAVRKLPEEIRETAVLYFFQELKQREIAELLHIKLSLVKYRIGRAKELLMKELEVKKMKNYKQQIKEYKEEIEEKYVRAEAENKTVKACQNILSESVLSKQSHRTSYFEFLYEQTKFIKKGWWILQGCVLMCLWIWLSNYTSDIKDMMRIMGISATIFVVLIIPEIWKNRRNGAIEIEQASYYTLRQICTARILMFGVVDLVIVMVFLAITYQTTILSLSDLVVNFLLPVNVSCCICFRVLYSRWEKSEYIAVLSCLVWVGLWMMIVANDVIYQKIVTPVWVAMLILTFVYFIFCVQKSLLFDEKILEDYMYEIRI